MPTEQAGCGISAAMKVEGFLFMNGEEIGLRCGLDDTILWR
jgi:hypothetical protein